MRETMRIKTASLATAFLLLFGGAHVRAQDLEIHCIDVGQGASELIIGPDGTTILIDGGTSSMGSSRVLPYLNDIFPPGDRTLDYVICSHDHGDHYGGLNHILGNGYSAGTVYHCGSNASFGRGQPIPVGAVIDLGGGATATCVLANGVFADGNHMNVGSDKNKQSICILVEYGGFDYITAGDLPDSLEDDLAGMLVSHVNQNDHPLHPNDTYLDPGSGVDILHMNHHGSRYSSCAAYVNLLRCEIAIAPGGTAYGHPTGDAVDRLLGRAFYTCSCYSTYGKPTGITAPGAEVYRTTAGSVDCRRSPEADCPTVGDFIIRYDGGPTYSIEGTLMGASSRDVDEAGGLPSPTPTATTAPPSQTPTPSPTTGSPVFTPTFTPTPAEAVEIAATSFEDPQQSDPIGYTTAGNVPDDPGLDEWGRWYAAPRSGSYSFAARDCTGGGRCIFDPIDISGSTGVTVHLWLRTSGDFEGGDYARAYAVVDGADQPYFFNLVADNLDHQSYREYTYDVPDGSSTITLVYEVLDSANTEYIYLDDVRVTADPPPADTPTATATPTVTATPTITPTTTPWPFPRKISFQPSSSQPRDGFAPSDGSRYNDHTGYGWM